MYSPLSIKRRHVLGDLYAQCDNVESIPVYLDDASGELLGHVDESAGKYADTFMFHLPEDICKKLSSSQYDYAFDYDYTTGAAGKSKRIKLNHILLIAKKGLPRRIPAK